MLIVFVDSSHFQPILIIWKVKYSEIFYCTRSTHLYTSFQNKGWILNETQRLSAALSLYRQMRRDCQNLVFWRLFAPESCIIRILDHENILLDILVNTIRPFLRKILKKVCFPIMVAFLYATEKTSQCDAAGQRYQLWRCKFVDVIYIW